MSISPPPAERDLRHIIEHTSALWDEIRGHRILVTGGTGFVGRWMLESLVWANDQLNLQARVTVLSRQPAAFAAAAPRLAKHSAVTMLAGDVKTFSYPDEECSHVLHLATESGPSLYANPGPTSFATAVEGTERVLAFAASHGTRKLLFTSSGAIYGRQPEGCERTPESYLGAPLPPGDPNEGYALGKRAAEALCLTATKETELQAKIARCFAFVGPYMRFNAGYAIGNFIHDAICSDGLNVTGDGTPLRSYLYAADLAIWLWTILFAGDNATPYNVGSQYAISVADLARLVARVAGNAKPVSIAKSPPPDAASPARYVPDTSRAELGLGLRAEIGLEEAVRRTADWYRSTL